MLQCVLQCVAVCCSVLQCVAVCCSVLQYVAVCCSVLHKFVDLSDWFLISERGREREREGKRERVRERARQRERDRVRVTCVYMQYVAVCVAVYFSVLQCVAVCCSVLHKFVALSDWFLISERGREGERERD